MFSWGINSNDNLPDTLKALFGTWEFTSKVFFYATNRILQSQAFQYLWLISQNPFELLKELLEDSSIRQSIFYNTWKLEWILTPEQIAFLDSHPLNTLQRNIPIPEDPVARWETIRDALYGMIEVRDFSRFTASLDDTDKKDIDPRWVLQKMIEAGDYLSILENRGYLGITHDQILQYANIHLTNSFDINNYNRTGRLFQLVDGEPILSVFIPFIIQKIIENSAYPKILWSSKLLEFYWWQRLFDDLLNLWNHTLIAENIFLMKPSLDRSILLANQLSQLKPDKTSFQNVPLGLVWKYIRSIWW